MDEYLFCPLKAGINRLLGIEEGDSGEQGGESAIDRYGGGGGGLDGAGASGGQD